MAFMLHSCYRCWWLDSTLAFAHVTAAIVFNLPSLCIVCFVADLCCLDLNLFRITAPLPFSVKFKLLHTCMSNWAPRNYSWNRSKEEQLEGRRWSRKLCWAGDASDIEQALGQSIPQAPFAAMLATAGGEGGGEERDQEPSGRMRNVLASVTKS